MKKITWESIEFWIIYGTGLAALAVLAAWLIYQMLCLVKNAFEFLCSCINPVFGIMCICGVFFLLIFGNAETRR